MSEYSPNVPDVDDSSNSWCFNRETGILIKKKKKLGDSREDRESWQIWLSAVSEHYGRNYSSLNNGFKFHALRGWIFVLRVLDCYNEY